MARLRLTPTDLRDAQAMVVVTVKWIGRTWHLGDHAMDIGTHRIIPGIVEAPQITDELDLSGGGGDKVTVSVAIVLPDLDIPAMVAAGHLLVYARAEVAIVFHRWGTALHNWEDREILAEGSLVGSHFGSPRHSAGWLATTIEDSPYRKERPILSRQGQVTQTTWPTSTDQGERYPLVIGAPTAPEDNYEVLPPAPVITVAAGAVARVCVSTGPIVADTTTARVWDQDGLSDILDLAWSTDGRGQRIVSALVTGSALAVSGSYWSEWDQGAAFCPFQASGPALALQVAAWMLQAGGADIDLPAWLSAGAWYRVRCAGYVDDPDARAWEAALAVLAGLPIGTRRADDGWAPAILDPGAWPKLAQTVVREGDGPWRRVSHWQTEEGTSRIGEVEVQYRRYTVTIGSAIASDGPLPYAAIRGLSELGSTSINLMFAGGRAAAHKAASWYARARSFGWEASSWVVPAHSMTWRTGDVVRLIEADSSQGWAIISRRTLVDGVWDVALSRLRGA